MQISESRVGRVIRTADYLYSVYAPGQDGFRVATAQLYADDFLYDLPKDLNQLNNLIGKSDYSEIRDSLRSQLIDRIAKVEGSRPEIVDCVYVFHEGEKVMRIK